MITSIANFLVKRKLPQLAGLELTLASFLIGRKNRIKYTDGGFWKHTTGNLILNDAFPDIRFDSNALTKFIEEVYFHEYVPEPGDVCIDIGAGIGSETIYMSRKLGRTGVVYSVEASPRTFSILQQNIRDNNLTNVRASNIAISNSNENIRITEIADHHIVNTVLGNEGLEIPALTMDEFIRRNDITRIDYLKVNIEGAEKLLIQQFEKVKMVKNIAISCHDFLGKRLNDEQYFTKQKIEEFLRQNNFQLSSRSTGTDYMDDWIYAKGRA